VTNAVDVAISDEKGKNPTFEYGGETWEVREKPPTLMLAEFARTDDGDATAMGVLADFFELVLGDQYPAFRKVVYKLGDAGFIELFHSVLELALGRPSE
jgi:hypothetical protein